MRTDQETTVPETDDRGEERARIRRGVLYCVGVFAVMRVALTVVATLSTALLPHPTKAIAEVADIPRPVDVRGWPAPDIEPGIQNVVTAWERYDALWFLRIADEGYRDGDGSAVFFPGYPMLVRGVSFVLGGAPLAAGLLVSNLAFLGALIVLHFLTAGEYGERVARRSVLYLAVFPTAFFFLAPYTEGPFLLFALLAFWGARRRRWVVAGAAGAAAALTRNVGLLLTLPLLVEGYQQWREARADGDDQSAWSLARPLLATTAVGLGTLVYLLFWQLKAGDLLAPLHQQATWEREFSLPWTSVWLATQEAFRWIGDYPGGYHLLDWLLVVPALVAAGWTTVRTRPAYAIYAWSSLIVPLSFVFLPRPFMSLPRFLLVIFPLVWAAAVWAERRRGVHEAILAISGVGLGLMTVLFVNWYFVF